MPVTHIVIQLEEAGQKIVQLLQRRVGGEVPKSALMRVIRKGQVRVDGHRVKPFDRVAKGQVVRIPPFKTAQPCIGSSIAEPFLGCSQGPLPIVFQNKEMLVINKPAGLPVHPGTGWSDSVTTRLGQMFLSVPFSPVLVHRLDKNTSGILLVAKSYGFLRAMQNRWKNGEVFKVYLAWVQGRWKSEKPVCLEDDLVKTGLPGHEKMRTGAGKCATCEVTPVLVRERASLLVVRLLTGRTHQIRVQLASRGFPLIGDPKYGGPTYPTMLLHAWSLSWGARHFAVLPAWDRNFGVDGILPSADFFLNRMSDNFQDIPMPLALGSD